MWFKCIEEFLPFCAHALIGHAYVVGMVERIFGPDVGTIDHEHLHLAGETGGVKSDGGFHGFGLTPVDDKG